MHKILSVSLSAALVSVRLAGTADAAYQPEDFERIETLIEDENWVALRTYLYDNPRILECNDDLAAELRRFLNNASGLYAALTFENSMYPDMSLRAFIPDDCILVADAPDAGDDADSGNSADRRRASDSGNSDSNDGGRRQTAPEEGIRAPSAARASTSSSIY